VVGRRRCSFDKGSSVSAASCLLGGPCGGLAPDGDGGAKRLDSVDWRCEATGSGAARRGPLVLGGHTVSTRLG
jgi:hypothetical protein